MHDKIQKNDFIELEFTGYLKDGQIFDTNIKEVGEKNKLDTHEFEKIICVSQGFLVKGFDSFLVEKEIGKEYEIQLEPEDAFGKRNQELIKTMPISVFHAQKINPVAGMSFLMDNYMVRISAVSGGRVIADFNNPLAGKIVVYKFKIIRKITDINEKIKALMHGFFKHEFDFSVNENEKVITLKAPKTAIHIIELTKQKWKDILGFELKTEEKKEKK